MTLSAKAARIKNGFLRFPLVTLTEIFALPGYIWMYISHGRFPKLCIYFDLYCAAVFGAFVQLPYESEEN